MEPEAEAGGQRGCLEVWGVSSIDELVEYIIQCGPMTELGPGSEMNSHHQFKLSTVSFIVGAMASGTLEDNL